MEEVVRPNLDLLEATLPESADDGKARERFFIGDTPKRERSGRIA